MGWRRCLESGLEIESAAAFLFTQMQAIAQRDQLGLESAIIFPVVPTQPSQILPLQTSARSRLALIDGAERNLFLGPARTPEYSLVRRARPSNKDADSDDCGHAIQLNAATRSDRRRPPFPMKATGLHCRHGDLGQGFLTASRAEVWAVIFRMLSPLRSRRCAL